MTLAAHVVTTVGSLRLDIDFRAEPGRVVAVLGPNGAGKTTLLRALAGLTPLDAGSIVLDGDVLDDVATRAHVEPERRGVGLMFQSARLFRHLSVVDNVAFGLRATGVPTKVARVRAAQLLEQVGLSEFAKRRPANLSGGEAQRVALARALAVQPRLLLLDEPLAAVDAQARVELQGLLRTELSRPDLTAVIVTHDPGDASAIADEVVVIEGGRTTQRGDIAESMTRPRSRWLAAMVGLNLLTVGEARAAARRPGAVWQHMGDSCWAAFAPSSITLSREDPGSHAAFAWRGSVATLRQVGGANRVTVVGDVTLEAQVGFAESALLELGQLGPVWASVDLDAIDVYASDQAIMPTSSGTEATDSADSRSISP